MTTHTDSNTVKPITIVCPVMTKARFGEKSGLRENQVRGQVERDNLPVIKVGRLSLINLVLIDGDHFGGAHVVSIDCPVMTAHTFAEASGLTTGQVETQLSLLHLPRRRVGRLVLVDVADLFRRCLAIVTPIN